MIVFQTIKPKPIEQQREHERRKYQALQDRSPAYGATNHGSESLALVQLYRPRFTIDLGCGRNQFARDLRRRGFDALGVDWVYHEADHIAPMHRTGLMPGTADLITAFDSLEHLITEDVPRVMREMQRLAAPHARFIFSISTRPSRIKVLGEGLHPTVRPLSWWGTQISKVGIVESMNARGRYITGRFRGK